MLRVSWLWLRSIKPLASPSFLRSPLNLLSRSPNSAFSANFHSAPFSRHYHSTRSIFSMSPTTNGVEKHGNFDLITRAKLDYADILVSKWKSRVTGLSVVHLDYNGTSYVLYLQSVHW
jgi:hypothetical protein